MNISEKGLNLIKEFEGCVLHAYRDAVGVVTIGYGTTNADASIIGTNIYMGMTISQATADSWLEKSVNKKYVPLVMKYDYKYHWNQNQLDGLTSFAYNIGSIDQLVQYGRRTISEISNAILYYDKAGGQVLAGLTRRRKAEKTLFDSATSTAPTGWIKDTEGWWYRYSDGTYPKSEWKEIKGKWYYFKADGYMAEDEYIKSSTYSTDKKLYYVDKSGAWDNKTYRWMQNDKGWWIAQVGGSWYPKNEMCKIDGVNYYFNSRGYWQESDSVKNSLHKK